MNERLFFQYKSNSCERKNDEISVIKRIYEQMADDISKQIFIDRLCFCLTKKFNYIRNVILSTKEGVELQKILEKNKDNIYIYGAGIRGERIGRVFDNINWTGYIDCVKKGECNEINIYRVQEVPNRESATVVISNEYGDDEIKEQLIDNGFLPKNIISLNEYNSRLAKMQYFEEFLKIKKGAMVDAGGYDGEEVIKYMKYIGDDECKFYLFEPDKNNYEICKKRLKKYKNGIVYNMGLSDTEGIMKFVQSGNSSATFSNDGTEEVEVTTIDCLHDDICFLKVDVEGGEKNLLNGASNTIRLHKPSIAISIYHKEEDIVELPQILLNLNPNYKFYIRHYSVGTPETVLYAIDNE